jgi:hypothetical protein
MHSTRTRRRLLTLAGALVVAIGAPACGGGGDSPEGAVESGSTTLGDNSTTDDDMTITESAAEESVDSGTAGPVPAPGKGSLALDDGRTFAITVTSCNLGESEGGPTAGSFEVKGTSEKGSTFEMTQFFLNGSWSQSDASIEFPSRDQIYVLAFASSGAEPATVEGTSVSWTQTFRELDESANQHVYTGEGSFD